MGNFTYVSTQIIKSSIFTPNNKNAGSLHFSEFQSAWILIATAQLNHITHYNVHDSECIVTVIYWLLHKVPMWVLVCRYINYYVDNGCVSWPLIGQQCHLFHSLLMIDHGESVQFMQQKQSQWLYCFFVSQDISKMDNTNESLRKKWKVIMLEVKFKSKVNGVTEGTMTWDCWPCHPLRGSRYEAKRL